MSEASIVFSQLDKLGQPSAVVAGEVASLRLVGHSMDQEQPATGKFPVIQQIRSRYKQGELNDKGDDVRKYLNALDRYPLLEASEEVELARIMEAGTYAGALLTGAAVRPEDGPDDRTLANLERQGKTAREMFIECNLRLVIKHAREYTGLGVEFLDLIQEGNYGLQDAVDGFDFARGLKFSTYAASRIKKPIRLAVLRQPRTVRVPDDVVERLNRIKVVDKELLSEEVPVTDEEVARRLQAKLTSRRDDGITPQKVSNTRRYGKKVASLDKPVDVDSGLGESLGNLIEEDGLPDLEDQVTIRQRSSMIGGVLAGLEPGFRRVAELKIGLAGDDPMNPAQISEVTGLPIIKVHHILFHLKAELQSTIHYSSRSMLDI